MGFLQAHQRARLHPGGQSLIQRKAGFDLAEVRAAARPQPSDATDSGIGGCARAQAGQALRQGGRKSQPCRVPRGGAGPIGAQTQHAKSVFLQQGAKVGRSVLLLADLEGVRDAQFFLARQHDRNRRPQREALKLALDARRERRRRRKGV